MDKHYTPVSDEKIISYLLGEADVAQKQTVEDWARADRDNQKKLDQFKTILRNSELLSGRSDVDPYQALQKVNLRIGTKGKNKIRFTLLRWAAVITLFTGLGLVSYYKILNQSLDIRSKHQTLSQTLPDGSTIFLNRYSALSYRSGIFSKQRSVELSGEAFFKVSPNKNKPFIIKVNGILITVVGTSFNVKGSEREVRVDVEEGIVRVSDSRRQLNLSAGERTIVPESAGELSKMAAQGKLYSYYYSGKLICQNTPLSELIPVLNEKFGSSIKIGDPKIAALTLTTTFTSETLPEILKVIEETFNIKAIYSDKEILLQ